MATYAKILKGVKNRRKKVAEQIDIQNERKALKADLEKLDKLKRETR